MNDPYQALQGLLDTRQWEAAWVEFQNLHSDGPPTPRLLLMGSHAAFGRQEHYTARRLADEALAALTPDDPPRLTAQIRFHLGRVAMKAGDVPTALHAFRWFLVELPAHPEFTKAEAQARFYLALALRQHGELDEAVEEYRQAEACARRDGLSLLCTILQNLAWTLCQLQRPVEATDCLVEAGTLTQTPEDRLHQTLGEAFLAAIEGNLLQAAERCETVFRMAERGEPVSPEERSQAAWIAGTAALAEGNLTRAQALANEAWVLANRAGDARLIGDANALRGKLTEIKR